jgi:hypothetical protein
LIVTTVEPLNVTFPGVVVSVVSVAFSEYCWTVIDAA